MRISLPLAAALLALGGCSSDSTGSNGPLTGLWTYEVLDVRSPIGEESCSITDVEVRLQQRGDGFSGLTSGGFARCMRGTEQLPPMALDPAPVTGRVDGTQVEFDIGDVVLNQGTLMDDEITGTADFGSGVTAAFTMTRR
jgi:hypothetical protein